MLAGGLLLLAASQPALVSPAPAGSFAPQLSRAAGGTVLLSWLETAPNGHRLRAARLRNGRWESPATIAEGVEFFANWADVPSVSEQAGVLFAHWLEKSGAGAYAYDVKVRVSTDAGATWGAAFVPHSDRSASEHGFASFFVTPGNKPALAWLDGRESAGGEHGGHGGAMTLRAAAVGPGGSAGETLLDGRVCDCCPTAAIGTPGGALVAYRDRSDAEVRDISVVRFDGAAWSAPMTMKDGWQINGCPVNGPALAARGNSVALAWFTAPDDAPAIRLARSADGGKTWTAPLTLSEGVPLGRVAIAMTDDGATHVAWLDHNGGNGRLVVRHIDAGGRPGAIETLAPMKTDRNSGYPRLIADGNRLIYAWTDAKQVRLGFTDSRTQ
jgi:hypothetical protein